MAYAVMFGKYLSDEADLPHHAAPALSGARRRQGGADDPSLRREVRRLDFQHARSPPRSQQRDYIELEFAQAKRRFGSRVIVVAPGSQPAAPRTRT